MTERTSGKVRNLSAVDLEYMSAIGAELDLEEIDIGTLSDAISIDEDEITTWFQGLRRKKQIVFYGPPGTGKTYIAERIAEELTDGTDGFFDLVQFHQSFEYEDFIQGIRPKTDEEGDLTYLLQDGTFVEFCNEARERNSPCVIIVDEINRADVASVFGELMFLLEYRGEEHSIKLAQHTDDEEKFAIPDNAYIIGTMNTADRSIALVDFALRRRFAFIPLRPNFDVLREHHAGSGHDVDELIEVLQEINQEIGDQNFEIGFTYFLDIDLRDDLENVWKYEIEPYLEEYFIDNPSTIEEYGWENVDFNL